MDFLLAVPKGILMALHSTVFPYPWIERNVFQSSYICISGVASTTQSPTTLSTPSQVPRRQKRQVQGADNQTDATTSSTPSTGTLS